MPDWLDEQDVYGGFGFAVGAGRKNQTKRAFREIHHGLSEQRCRVEGYDRAIADSYRRNRRYFRTAVSRTSQGTAELAGLCEFVWEARTGIRAGEPLGVQQLWIFTAWRSCRAGQREKLLRLCAGECVRAGGHELVRLVGRGRECARAIYRLHGLWRRRTSSKYGHTSLSGNFGGRRIFHSGRSATICRSADRSQTSERRIYGLAHNREGGCASRREVRVWLFR